MVVENTPVEATEAAGMTTVTGITQEPERKAQVTENPEAGGTPGGRLETGRTVLSSGARGHGFMCYIGYHCRDIHTES